MSHLMPEQGWERFHTWCQAWISRLHLATQARHKVHGRVESVFMHQVAIVPNEGQHTVEASCLEHCASLSSTHKLQNLQQGKKHQLWSHRTLHISQNLLIHTSVDNDWETNDTYTMIHKTYKGVTKKKYAPLPPIPLYAKLLMASCVCWKLLIIPECTNWQHKWGQFYLDALLGQVLAGAGGDIGHHQTVAHGFDGALDCGDAAGAFCWHIQVVGDGAGRHLQDIIWRTLVQEDATQGRQEGPWRAAEERRGCD